MKVLIMTSDNETPTLLSLSEFPDRPCAKCKGVFSPSSAKQSYCRDCFRAYYRKYRKAGRCKCGRTNCGVGKQGFGGGRPKK